MILPFPSHSDKKNQMGLRLCILQHLQSSGVSPHSAAQSYQIILWHLLACLLQHLTHSSQSYQRVLAFMYWAVPTYIIYMYLFIYIFYPELFKALAWKLKPETALVATAKFSGGFLLHMDCDPFISWRLTWACCGYEFWHSIPWHQHRQTLCTILSHHLHTIQFNVRKIILNRTTSA